LDRLGLQVSCIWCTFSWFRGRCHALGEKPCRHPWPEFCGNAHIGGPPRWPSWQPYFSRYPAALLSIVDSPSARCNRRISAQVAQLSAFTHSSGRLPRCSCGGDRSPWRKCYPSRDSNVVMPQPRLDCGRYSAVRGSDSSLTMLAVLERGEPKALRTACRSVERVTSELLQSHGRCRPRTLCVSQRVRRE
jgi:hypothetical protein